MKLSLGPLLYYWPKHDVEDFYTDIKTQPLNTIYLGETICTKRQELHLQDWFDIATDLLNSGKEVVLSSLTLIESRADIKLVKKLCDNTPCLIEANDVGTINILTENKLPFIAGSAINIYNIQTLTRLHRSGLIRWVMPVELNREKLSGIIRELKNDHPEKNIETEVFSYGKLPLAYSARCFTAREKNLPKDNCRLSCMKYPDGLSVYSQEDQLLFTINGIQTQSGRIYNLLHEWQEMESMGVDMMRISPQKNSEHTCAIISSAHQAIEGHTMPLPLIASSQCNGYWYGKPGMDLHENTH